MIDLNTLNKKVSDYMTKYPHSRHGQAIINICLEMYPEATHELSGSEYDCFYNDKKICIFIEKLYEYMD